MPDGCDCAHCRREREDRELASRMLAEHPRPETEPRAITREDREDLEAGDWIRWGTGDFGSHTTPAQVIRRENQQITLANWDDYRGNPYTCTINAPSFSGFYPRAATAPQPEPASSPATRHCAECGEEFPAGQLSDMAGRWEERRGIERWICDDCNGSYRTCEHCGGGYPQGEVTERYDGAEEYLCNHCRELHYIQCDGCGDWVRDGDVTSVNGSDRCESCMEGMEQCRGCGDWFDSDDDDWTYGEDGYCRACAEREREREQEERENEVIGSHNDKVNTRPAGKGPVWYGVELEVEAGDDRVESAEDTISALDDYDRGDDYEIKRDGSLDNGFEIVTRPADWDWHKEFWGNIATPRAAGRIGIKSWKTTTCGMHVHASRKPLTELQIAKIALFLNRRANAELISAIAGRDILAYYYCQSKALRDKPRMSEREQTARYEPLNLYNRETIEFRIFKGTLKLSSILKNIEFCQALIAYCAPASRSLDDALDGDKWLEWMRKERKTYPNLAEWLTVKRFIPELPPSPLRKKPAGCVAAATSDNSIITNENEE
jgi:hypothetical protein